MFMYMFKAGVGEEILIVLQFVDAKAQLSDITDEQR